MRKSLLGRALGLALAVVLGLAATACSGNGGPPRAGSPAGTAGTLRSGASPVGPTPGSSGVSPESSGMAPTLPSRPSERAGATPAPSASEASAGDLVPFKGTVQAIFFHPLVVYPKMAFDGDSLDKGFREWFVTVAEFKRMLPQIYENGYILIDIHDLYTVATGPDGRRKIVRKTLLVPKGKKPLLLSIDDLNFYDYMRENGTAWRLVLDDAGHVATEVRHDGATVVTEDDGIIPLVDAFVAKHPDFSLNGAKGTINLTGFQGVLGYRTEPDAPDAAQERAAVKPVIAALKASGWNFACHGWGHRNDANISYASLVTDTRKWEDQVEPLVGPTDLYVYPFGAELKLGSKKMKYLVDQGFNVIFGVGPDPYWRWYDGHIALDRVHVDGLALTTQHKMLAPFFDATTVVDRSARGLPNASQ